MWRFNRELTISDIVNCNVYLDVMFIWTYRLLLEKWCCFELKQTILHCRQSPNGHDFIENIKHKLWLKVALDAIEIAHGEPQL